MGYFLGKKKVIPVKGVYLWGGVGRGKTYVMDLFFNALPVENKLRTHFHRFMRQVHHELNTLKEQKDPLDKVAAIFAQKADVICFDEFFVSEITDAMILANLLDGLFRHGVTLVATSNICPSGLYENGLQRESFLPAIKLLEQHTLVHHLDGHKDHRLRALQQADLYYHPINEQTALSMEACFSRLAGKLEQDSIGIAQSITGSQGIADLQSMSESRNTVEQHNCLGSQAGCRGSVNIEGRDIEWLKERDDLIWFDFSALCDGPRSQADYIVLAKEYHTVFISGIPQLDADRDDQARRFIYLVDEFYDCGVKLILSAEVAIAELYVGTKLAFDIQRTYSRLLEMQSHEYLSRPHKS